MYYYLFLEENMSRSIHQTMRKVFFLKSKREINEMFDRNNPDIDAIEILKKSLIKNKTSEQRKLKKIIKASNDDDMNKKINSKINYGNVLKK
jgi:phosphoglycerate-specific signal transduction histidine kinase